MELKETVLKSDRAIVLSICFFWFVLGGMFILFDVFENEKIYVPDITIDFMNFTMFNITETRFNASWNLSIRVPQNLPGFYICLQGDFQASLLYKNITIATSPTQSYNNLQPHWPQVLKVSGFVSEEDINGAIGKNIMDDIKMRSEVQFGSRLFLPDCRKNSTGTMKYACDEIKLPFDSSSQKITTIVVGNPTCFYDDN